jgi:hypothetical protein
VHFFCDSGITDATFSYKSASDNTKLLGKLEELRYKSQKRAKITELFDNRRWDFCPITLGQKHLDGQVIEKERRLPFCRRGDICGEGGQAKVRKVLVHEDFVEDEMAKRLGEPVEDEEYGRVR